MSCGLTATTTSAAPPAAAGVVERRLDPVALPQLGDARLAARRGDEVGGAAPAGREEARDERLADPARAEDRDPLPVDRHEPAYAALRALRRATRAEIRGRPGDEAARPAEHEHLAREPLPLLVRREERGGLGTLDPAAGQRRVELDEREVADEPVVVASEPFERDHADRPRADAALARETAEDDAGVGGRAAARGRRSRTSRASVVARDCARPRRRRSSGESRRSAGCETTRLAARPCDGPLERARATRLDQLAADRPDRGLGDGREPERAVADEGARGGTDERVAGEAPVEAARVVGEREHEPGRRERLLVGGADDDPSVGPLVRRRDPLAGERAPPGAAPRHEAKPVRPDRRDDVLDHGRRHYCPRQTRPVLCPRAARRRALAPLAQAEARPLPRADGAGRVDDRARRRRRRGLERGGRRRERLHDPQLLRGALPVARAHHGARAPRRRRASASATPRSPTSRATRARSRSRTAPSTSSTRTP